MKYNRHIQILKLISENDIETQEELLFELKKLGNKVTQATISRDIKELGLTKIVTHDGRYKYSQYDNPNFNPSSRFLKIFKESTLSLNHAMNMVVVKTYPGTASAAAAAIDSFKIESMLGSLAGDDTIFILAKSEEDAIAIIDILKNYLED